MPKCPRLLTELLALAQLLVVRAFLPPTVRRVEATDLVSLVGAKEAGMTLVRRLLTAPPAQPTLLRVPPIRQPHRRTSLVPPPSTVQLLLRTRRRVLRLLHTVRSLLRTVLRARPIVQRRRKTRRTNLPFHSKQVVVPCEIVESR